jgi:hypothetical protein
VPLKVVPKPGCDSEHCSESRLNVHYNKSTNESKGKPEQKFDAAFGTTFTISKVFREASKNFNLNFSITKQAENLKIICACKEILI